MDALAFDVTCAFRLEIYENDKQRASLENLSTLIANKVSMMFGDGEPDDGDVIRV